MVGRLYGRLPWIIYLFLGDVNMAATKRNCAFLSSTRIG